MSEGQEIRTEPVSRCAQCGNENRRILYAGLSDRLFGVPGEWSLKKCLGCGLVFLDPRPLESEIWKAYSIYYTHREIAIDQRHDGKQNPILNTFRIANGVLSGLLSVSEQRSCIKYMYLLNRSPGRLLDVGSGQGIFLDRMRRVGWIVEGVETDPTAADFARRNYRVDVHTGDLHSAKYPDGYFDVITMNHVIEHVHDPIALLRECRRILCPGGALVAVTPNIQSWGHRKFSSKWRGLEPPRHLHLFSPGNLMECAERAGYRGVHTWTTAANAEGILAGTLEARDSADKPALGNVLPIQRRLVVLSLQYWEALLLKFDSRTGEEAVLWAENV